MEVELERSASQSSLCRASSVSSRLPSETTPHRNDGDKIQRSRPDQIRSNQTFRSMIKFSQKLLSTLAMIPNAKATVFPTLGLLPKTETNAASFLANTGYDGRFALPTILTSGMGPPFKIDRNIVCAILDTGEFVLLTQVSIQGRRDSKV